MILALCAFPALSQSNDNGTRYDFGGKTSDDPCVKYGPESEDCRAQDEPDAPVDPEPCADGFERREDGNCYPVEPPPADPVDPNPAAPCGSDTGPRSSQALIFDGETIRGEWGLGEDGYYEVENGILEPFAWQRCAGQPARADLVTIKPDQCNRITGVIRSTGCKKNGFRHIQWHPNELGSYQELRVLNPVTGQENTYRKLPGTAKVERYFNGRWAPLFVDHVDTKAFACIQRAGGSL